MEGDMKTTHGHVGCCVRSAMGLCVLLTCAGAAWGGPGVGRAGESAIGLGPRTGEGAGASGPERPAVDGGVEAGAVRVGGIEGVVGGARGVGGIGGGVGGVIETAGPLLVVVCVAVVVLRLVRRVSASGGLIAEALGARGRAPSGVIEVLGRYPVARGQLLVLVKLDRRVLLLGHSAPARGAGGGPGGGFVTLAEVTDPEEVAALLVRVREGRGESVGARFGAMLRAAGGAAAFDAPTHGDDAWEDRGEPASSAAAEPIAAASVHAVERAPLAQSQVAAMSGQMQAGAGEAGASEWGRVRERLASLRGRSAGMPVGGVA